MSLQTATGRSLPYEIVRMRCAFTPREASAKRDVVLAGAALIGMPFNRERVLAVGLKPLRLLLQGRNGLRCQLGRVRFEEDPVAHIDDKVLLASRRRHTGGLGHIGGVRAPSHAKGNSQSAGERCPLDGTSNSFRHSGAPFVA